MELLFLILKGKKKILTVKLLCLRESCQCAHCMTQFGIEEVVGIKSSLEFFTPLCSSLCSCEERQSLTKMWTSETHLCRHKRIHVIHSPWSRALWSHSQVQHRCLGRKLTFSKCLVKAWDSRQSSGGSLGNLVGACVIATQSCPWQAKWLWAILIPSSLIFFFCPVRFVVITSFCG